MAGENCFFRIFTNTNRAEGRHAADKTIHDDWHAIQRTAEEHAAKSGDIQPAELAQHIQRVIRIRLIDGNAALNGADFPLQPLIGQSRAASGHPFDILMQQNRRNRAGRGRVADAHFARRQQRKAHLLPVADEVHADFNRRQRLFTCHRRALREIRRAG